MSTKIYNGIKFKSRNLTEILYQLQNIRNILLNICKSEEYVPQENLIDFINYKKLISNINDNESKLMFEINRKIQDAINLNDEDVCWLIPFNATVFVIPFEDGNFYGGLFCDNKIARNYFNDCIEDFHYQDQTDKPDEISDEDWHKRQKIWDKIFETFWTFPETGFEYKILKGNDFHLWDRIKDAIKTIKKETNG